MVYEISGYWKDDNTEFSNYLVTDYDCVPEGYNDDDIFFFGMSEEDIKSEINHPSPIIDFVITDYKVVS